MSSRYFNTAKNRYFGAGAGRAANGVIADESGSGGLQFTTLRFTRIPVTVGNTTGASFGSLKIYDFSLGQIRLHGGRANLTFNWAGQDIAAGGSGDFSLGTTATADASLATTEVDIMPSTAMLDPFVAGIGTGRGNLVVATSFDGTGTAKDMFLNIIIDDADVADAASDIVLVSGTIIVEWANYGA